MSGGGSGNGVPGNTDVPLPPNIDQPNTQYLPPVQPPQRHLATDLAALANTLQAAGQLTTTQLATINAAIGVVARSSTPAGYPA